MTAVYISAGHTQ